MSEGERGGGERVRGERWREGEEEQRMVREARRKNLHLLRRPLLPLQHPRHYRPSMNTQPQRPGKRGGVRQGRGEGVVRPALP